MAGSFGGSGQHEATTLMEATEVDNLQQVQVLGRQGVDTFPVDRISEWYL